MKYPDSVGEWITYLILKGNATVANYTHQQQADASKALENAQRRCAEWLKAHPEVKADFLRSQKWAK